MARITNLVEYNLSKELVKLSVDKDEVLLTTKDELKDFFLVYLEKEMDLISSSISQSSKRKLVEMIDEKLANFQNQVSNHVEQKLNKAVEKIITKILSSEIESEIKRRVNLKLDEIKQKL
jgi:hypothetical protein